MSPQFLRNEQRLSQTKQELDILKSEFAIWLKVWRDKDCQQQKFTSQLSTLDTVLTSMFSRIYSALDVVSTHSTSGEVYRQCRQIDQTIVWTRRVWEYFKDKFEQRNQPRFKDVLIGADEVIWSCYASVFKNIEQPRPPAPLAYIEPTFSPQAFPRGRRPPETLAVPAVDQDFQSRWKTKLDELPLPLVALPPSCAQSPWWLIYIAHEVGHHIEFDLGLVQSFRAALESQFPGKGGNWSLEIFADAFSIYMLGPWAVWAMAELELTDDVNMLKERPPAYPAPLVRLELMAKLADALGLFVERRWEAQVDSIPDILPALVKQIQQPLGSIGTLADICAWNKKLYPFSENGPVQKWAERLLTDSPFPPEKRLDTARWIVCGSLQAWSQYPDQAEMLCRRTLAGLAISHDEGRRSAEQTFDTAHATTQGIELAEFLLTTDMGL